MLTGRDRVFAMPDGDDVIRVWSWSPRDAEAGLAERDLRPVTEEERRRVRGVRPAQATRFLARRATVRSVLAGPLDTPAERIVLGRHPCPGCGDPGHGPPKVVRPATGLWISVSHTGDLDVLAVGPHRLGVDVERHGPVDLPSLSRAALTAPEAAWVAGHQEPRARVDAFYRCWTRKEAVLKAIGIGLAGDPRRWDTRPWLERAVLTGDPVRPERRWTVENPPVGDGVTLAIGRPAEARAEVRLLTWPPADGRVADGRQEGTAGQKAGQSAGSAP
ncbi:hypothetical protein BBN63_28705 [Streptomyces niveus]|uniref:4'-phosphopantetheinyl transferase domain-containing protein n=2 Tax=Streptomyces niveus TaxID=193462 RepID=A0A1U9QZH6_STRNV|nr:hypothetical protein BBN63_28705 [Streptomyces niveus]